MNDLMQLDKSRTDANIRIDLAYLIEAEEGHADKVKFRHSLIFISIALKQRVARIIERQLIQSITEKGLKMTKYDDLAGKVIILTGAAGGQGTSEAEAFASAGAKLMLTDIAGDVSGLADRLGGDVIFRKHDVSSEEDWQSIVDEAVVRFGRVDVLVNNAGIFTPGVLGDATVASFDAHYRVNQLGPFLGVKSVLPVMEKQRSGSIINISSAAGMRGFPGFIAYTSTKWAVRGMTQAMARELAPHNIRVNSVHPGLVRTQMLGDHTPEGLAELESSVPLGRIATPQDVCNLVLYLSSDVSSYMTGAVIPIDGGVSL